MSGWMLRPRAMGALLVAFLMTGPELAAPAFAEPPPWAPAHGWRAKQTLKYQSRYGNRRGRSAIGPGYVGRDPIAVPDDGPGSCNRALIGSLLGAAAGGAPGRRVAGSAAGALLEDAIGGAMDRIDQNCVGHTLEAVDNERSVKWMNPDSRRGYRVMPTRTYRNASGAWCREFTTEVTIGSRTEIAGGVACRAPDGSWKTGN